ncbi:MAG TPA: tol-pal system protein YbgF [Polyangia bacterium]|jgi:tol-pal system protein YbgF
MTSRINDERWERWRDGVVLLAMGLSAGAWGCATAPRPKAAPGDADRTIAELRAKNAGDARRIEELENRIFILEDRLDSHRLAAEQRAPATLPPRPTVAAPPSVTAAPVAHEASAPSPDDAESSLLAEQEVEYAGAALPASANGRPARAVATHRPMLRLGAPEPRSDTRGIPAPAEPLRLYRQALEALRAGQQQAALAGFRHFLEGNPRHDYADNAQYWIGECYYDLHDYPAAEPEFRKVIETYPHGNKVPDAMLKLGFTLMAEGQAAAGQAVLESLTRAFPKHEAARLGSYRLAHPDEGDGAPNAAAPSPAQKGAVLGTLVPAHLGAGTPRKGSP